MSGCASHFATRAMKPLTGDLRVSPSYGCFTAVKGVVVEVVVVIIVVILGLRCKTTTYAIKKF